MQLHILQCSQFDQVCTKESNLAGMRPENLKGKIFYIL